jgi:hypothetical protein
MTREQHLAWLDGLTDDELRIAETPPGYLSSFVMVSWLKHILTTREMRAEERLELLEALGKLLDVRCAAVLVAIRPASGVEVTMIQQALAAGPAALDLLGSFEVFAPLARLNSSLMEAIKIWWPDWLPVPRSKINAAVN